MDWRDAYRIETFESTTPGGIENILFFQITCFYRCY